MNNILFKKSKKLFSKTKKDIIFAPACQQRQARVSATITGEMAEWSNALVLKTSEGHTSGGSNPSFSAETFSKITKTL